MKPLTLKELADHLCMAGRIRAGRRLRIYRAVRELSLRDVAIALDTNESTVCRWERGTREPRSDMVRKLAATYGFVWG